MWVIDVPKYGLHYTPLKDLLLQIVKKILRLHFKFVTFIKWYRSLKAEAWFPCVQLKQTNCPVNTADLSFICTLFFCFFLHLASVAVGREKHMLSKTVCNGRAHCGFLGCRPFVSLMFRLIFLQLKIGWLIGWRPEPSKPLLLSVSPLSIPTISERWPSVRVCWWSHHGVFWIYLSVVQK